VVIGVSVVRVVVSVVNGPWVLSGRVVEWCEIGRFGDEWKDTAATKDPPFSFSFSFSFSFPSTELPPRFLLRKR
jgi:hypothetical protein